jgi:type I restriction enzyme S subunit
MSFSERLSKSTKNQFTEGDVLYGKLRPYLNKVIIADQDGYCTTEIIPLKPNILIDGKYLFYWFKHPEFLEYVDSVSHGIQMPRLGTDAGLKAPLVLAPLNEQRRIVDKLERIGDRNRTARNELNHIPKLIARYKQAVLAAACSGKLTEDWRENNDCKTWEITNLDAVANIVDPHPSHRTPIEYPDGIPYVGIGDIDSSGNFDFVNSRKVSPDILKEHQERYTLSKGDFVFGKIGTLGNVTPLPLGIEYTLSANVILIQPKIDFVEPPYLMFFLQSPQTMKEITSQSSSTSQAAFGIKKMRAFQFLMPDLKEQKEIVRRIEKMFEKIDRMEQEYQKAAKLCDRLEQATLAKAFRGELVPQDPDDEPASVLLEQVKSQKEKGKKGK